eukprot:PhF_6_TR450/c0_g1_i1/m.178
MTTFTGIIAALCASLLIHHPTVAVAILVQQDFLRQLYLACDGSNWVYPKGEVGIRWDTSSSDYCSFYGVTCDGTDMTVPQQLIQLQLRNYNLRCNPQKFTVLRVPTNVLILDLSHNDLGGADVGDMFPLNTAATPNNLDRLSLWNAKVGGRIPTLPPTVRTLNLANNQYSDTNQLFNLTKISYLKRVDLSSNLFQGTFPCEILPSLGRELSYFDISYNQFSGKICAEFGQLPAGSTLNLLGNPWDLNQSFPVELAKANLDVRITGTFKGPCPIPAELYKAGYNITICCGVSNCVVVSPQNLPWSMNPLTVGFLTGCVILLVVLLLIVALLKTKIGQRFLTVKCLWPKIAPARSYNTATMRYELVDVQAAQTQLNPHEYERE